jgi:hypothetical protein
MCGSYRDSPYEREWGEKKWRRGTLGRAHLDPLRKERPLELAVDCRRACARNFEPVDKKTFSRPTDWVG